MQALDEIKFYYGKPDEEIKQFWKAVFEEADGFLNYYFEKVAPKTKILIAQKENELVGMVSLNPYNVYCKGKEIIAYYVVGVAVKESYRKKGIMTRMMNKVIFDSGKEKIPFLFLMPERKEYYSSIGFKHIYKTTNLSLELKDIDDVKDCFSDEIQINVLDKIDKTALSHAINKRLSEKYDFFSVRNEQYLENMIEEHRCQSGDVYVLSRNNVFCILTLDVYDKLMNAERVLNFGMDYDCVIETAINFAKIKGCDELTMTFDSQVFSKIESIIKKNYLGVVEKIKIKEGKGIMALCLDKEFSIDDMNKKSLFDEIV